MPDARRPLNLQYNGSPLEGMSDKEQAALLNVASGNFRSWTSAFRAAGYGKNSARARASEYRRGQSARHIRWREALAWALTQRLSTMAGKALTTLEELLDCPHPQTRARAAAEILDRAGYGREQNFHVRHTNEPTMTIADLRSRIAEQLSNLAPSDRDEILSQLNPAERETVLKITDKSTVIDLPCVSR